MTCSSSRMSPYFSSGSQEDAKSFPTSPLKRVSTSLGTAWGTAETTVTSPSTVTFNMSAPPAATGDHLATLHWQRPDRSPKPTFSVAPYLVWKDHVGIRVTYGLVTGTN